MTRNPGKSYNRGLNSLIAQLVERRTVNPQVPGSSPGRGAKAIKGLRFIDATPFAFLSHVHKLCVRLAKATK